MNTRNHTPVKRYRCAACGRKTANPKFCRKCWRLRVHEQLELPLQFPEEVQV